MLFKKLIVFIVFFVILLESNPTRAGEQPGDSVIVWGPVLSMINGRAFLALDTKYPVMARVIVDKQMLRPWDNALACHKEIQLPKDLKGKFTYQINLVSSDGTLTLGPYVARLPGEIGRNLEFVVYGDTRGEDSTHYQIVRQILASDPDFVLNTG